MERKQTVKIVAVSGGVDSVVLLDMMAKNHEHLIVAHVDHGIRPESAADARFVRGLAERYGLAYLQTELKLGADTNEGEARAARYAWLMDQAVAMNATLVTAHHRDDMVGSVAINLLRGTGWRGLAVLNRAGIERPLLTLRKRALYTYALKRRLEWVEDASNQSDRYLRNRLRARIDQLPDEVCTLIGGLRTRQQLLTRDIDRQTKRIAKQFNNARYPYTMVPEQVAIELLRAQWPLTRPMSQRLWLGIKTASPNAQLSIGDGLTAHFRKTTFTITSPPSVTKVIE